MAAPNTRTPFFARNQAGGMFALENQAVSTGDRFFVDDSGTDSTSRGKNPDAPLATIDYAIGLCTAGQGDIIYVMPGHAETVTAAITCDISMVSIIGLGEGDQRPVITGNGTIDAVTMTAGGVKIKNIKFAAPLTDAQTAAINIAAAGCVVRKCQFLGSVGTENIVDIITITATGHDALIEGNFIYNTVVDCISAIDLEGACARVIIRDNVIQGQFSTGVIIDSDTATLATIQRNILKNTKAATAVVTFTTGNSTGVCSFNHMSGRHTTIASNLVAGTGMDFFENRVVEEAAVNGAITVPAVDIE